MKTKYLFLALLSVTLFLGSCKKEEDAEIEEPSAGVESTTAVPKITTTPAQTAPTGEKPALNPAHGLPYHRCDIAVGAPLDGPATQQGDSPVKQSTGPKSFFKTVQSESTASASTQQSQPMPAATTTVSPTTNQVKTTTPATSTANTPKPKNNPAHGQPHHRCDIAVGAPLPDA